MEWRGFWRTMGDVDIYYAKKDYAFSLKIQFEV